MKQLTTLLLFPFITFLCASCSEAHLKASTVKTKKACHNPKLGQAVTVEIEYNAYKGKLSQISKDEIVVKKVFELYYKHKPHLFGCGLFSKS